MSCKVCPDYAKDYKNEFLFIRGIDKCFEYFLKNLDRATSGVFKNRVGKINKFLDDFDKLLLPNKPLNEIDENDVINSVNILDELISVTEFYVNDYYVFDQVAFVENVDKEFPGWTKLVETINLFHSKFKMVNKYNSFKIIKYDESDDEIVEPYDPVVVCLSEESDDEIY